MHQKWIFSEERDSKYAMLSFIVLNIWRTKLMSFTIFKFLNNFFFLTFLTGVDHGNLRELALERMEELDLQCRDVRTRGIINDVVHLKYGSASSCGDSIYVYVCE